METKYKRWQYVPLKKGLNYAEIMYSLGTPKQAEKRLMWSKPIKIGGKKFKSLLKDGKLDINDFPQYKIRSDGAIYFDTNNLRTQGMEFKRSVLSDDNLDKTISYNLMFYAPITELQKRSVIGA